MPSILKKINSSRTQSGFGFDSHAYSTSGHLSLGGLKIKNLPALKGHSDGDAVIHSLVDALLGAAGLGDIGEFFPDTSKKWKGAESRLFLNKTIQKIEKTFNVRHVDITILAERPKLSPIKTEMKKYLAKLLKVKPSQVNIKAKTPEGLQIFTEAGGVAVWSLVTLEEKK